MELVDWDEEDIDGAAPGMDVADAEAADAMAAHLTTMSSASKTAPPAMDPTGSVPVEHPKPTMISALKTMPPDPARSAPVEHPKPPGASRPPVLGHAGEARAGRATVVSPAKVCTASGRSVTSLSSARAAASPHPAPDSGPGGAAATGKVSMAKLKSVLVVPERQHTPLPHPRKKFWRRLDLTNLSAEGLPSLAACGSKPLPGLLRANLNSGPAKLWKTGECSRVNERLGELQSG